MQNNNHINTGLNLSLDSPLTGLSDTGIGYSSPLDVFSGLSSPPSDSSLTAYEKNGIHIVFNVEKATDAMDVVLIYVVATNASSSSITDFLFQVNFFYAI